MCIRDSCKTSSILFSSVPSTNCLTFKFSLAERQLLLGTAAVSYTNLDVYKRQMQHGETVSPDRKAIYEFIVSEQYRAIFTVSVGAIDAVSYTHLEEVYAYCNLHGLWKC